MSNEIIKLTRKFKYGRIKSVGMLTNEIRDYISANLGELEVATTFMYLYRRFGEPTFNNQDDYKILFAYHFMFGEVWISIHGSYHNHIYFNVHIPKQWTDEFWTKRKVWLNSLFDKYKDIAPIISPPYLPFEKQGYSKKNIKELLKRMNKEAKDYLTESELKIISDAPKDRTHEELQNVVKTKLFDYLIDKFYKNMTKEDEIICNKFIPTISDIPNLKEQIDYIIKELKRGFYIRDVRINILGYESKTNIIMEDDDNGEEK